MAKVTRIAWTDSTFNLWWGCSPISTGCQRCYARTFDKRLRGNYWEPGVSPRPMSKGYWAKPLSWNRRAEKEKIRSRVFCGSMGDWADANGMPEERERLWPLIKQTSSLDWLLLTKRADRIQDCLPADWEQGYPNVWLGVSVEDRAYGLPRIEHLKNTPAKVRFLSIEPLLEDLGTIPYLEDISWIIIGGESGAGARPMEGTWVRNVIQQCREKQVPVFFKQWGGKKANIGCLFEGREVKEYPTEGL